ncbi:V-set and immunoglobulin domain-containing protein 1 [Labeo rohita]|nr:V-set and immunoglobulin domain-containing protein 1 [Labeo rohita]
MLQPEEPDVAHESARTHGALNPETTIQSTATEQERSSPPVQSQEQERERPSESAMSLEGESTQTSERPEDERQRTQQTHKKKKKKKKDCGSYLRVSADAKWLMLKNLLKAIPCLFSLPQICLLFAHLTLYFLTLEMMLFCGVILSQLSVLLQWRSNGGIKNDLVCHYRNGQMIKSYEGRAGLSLQDLHNGNVSLTLKDVRRSQGGHYNCETSVLWFLLEWYLLSLDQMSFYLLISHLKPVLCLWKSDGQEMTNNDHVTRVSLSIQELRSGNLSLTLRNVQPSDSGEYTCKVFHNGCQKTGLVCMQVRETKRNDDSQRVKYLRAVLQQVHENIMYQKFKLQTETLQLIEETLNNDTSSTNKQVQHQDVQIAWKEFLHTHIVILLPSNTKVKVACTFLIIQIPHIPPEYGEIHCSPFC